MPLDGALFTDDADVAPDRALLDDIVVKESAASVFEVEHDVMVIWSLDFQRAQLGEPCAYAANSTHPPLNRVQLVQ